MFVIARALLALLLLSVPARAADMTVFAAASLSDTLPKVADAFKAKSGRTVSFSFAASSVLARQIEASGGADIFVSADKDWMDYLDGKNLITRASRTNLLSSHLVLIAPASSTLKLTIAPHFGLLAALAGERLSVADPASVPAGKYAKASLTTLGVWDSVADHLVQAENVRVALAYVARGEAPLGIVYATDAMADPNVRIVGTFPDDSHPAIMYPIALTRDAKPEAKAFMDFLASPPAAAIFTKAGFTVLH